MDRAAIERFVRDALGCACPDEVFERITIRNQNPCRGLPVDRSLEIGGRLLIYISHARDNNIIEESLGGIIEEGTRARDLLGFHRFRYCVAATSPEEAQGILEPLFTKLPIQDDRVHFHVVDSRDLDFLTSDRTVEPSLGKEPQGKQMNL